MVKPPPIVRTCFDQVYPSGERPSKPTNIYVILRGYDETGTKALPGGEEAAVGEAKDHCNLVEQD